MLRVSGRNASTCRGPARLCIVPRMDQSWRHQHLPEIVAALASRPGHESVRTLLAEILRHAFGAAYLDLDHEVRMPEIHGRADTLFGARHQDRTGRGQCRLTSNRQGLQPNTRYTATVASVFR